MTLSNVSLTTGLTPGSPGAVAPQSQADLRLLAVGENTGPLKALQRMAEATGIVLQPLPDASSALRALAQGRWDLLIAVLDGDEEEQLQWWVDVLRPAPRRPRLVALVPSPSIGFAMRAAHLGVFDVLPLDLSREQFRELLERIRSSSDESPIPLPNVRPVTFGTHAMVSESPAMLPVIRAIAQVAPSSASVLIIGESGTGKELVARAVHLHGPRAAAPFIASTAPPSRRTCSRASCSDTTRVPSPAPWPARSAGSSGPTAARCSSTRSAT